MATTITHPQRVALVKFLADSFSMAELDSLAFVFVGSSDAFAGNTPTAKAREMVEYARRRIQTAELFGAIQTERPEVDLRPFGGPAPQQGDSSAAVTSETATAPAQENVSTSKESVPKGIAYENFDINIGLKRGDGQYAVSAEAESGGQSGTILRPLALNDDEFKDMVDYLRDLVAEPDEAAEFGVKLREFLFPEKIWNLFSKRLEASKERGKAGLRICLHIDLQSPELSQIPWEYCRDDRENYVAINRKTPFVRYIPTDRTPEAISVPDKVRILIAMATPEDQDPIQVEIEEQRIRQALQSLEEKGKVEIQAIHHTTKMNLWDKFSDFRPHIFHFTGHGALLPSGDGAIILEDDDKQSDEVDADSMMTLLRSNDSLKLVILSACETAAHGASKAIMGVAPRLVWDGISAVLAMQFAVPDKTATQFMKNLYKSLAKGDPLDTAVSQARIGAYFVDNKSIYWAIPTLFMRAPNGNIWQ